MDRTVRPGWATARSRAPRMMAGPVDTSALVAALVADHEHHDLARPVLSTKPFDDVGEAEEI